MDLKSSDYKEIARDALKGHWWKAAIATLLVTVLGAFSMSFVTVINVIEAAAATAKYLEDSPYFFMLVCIGVILIAILYFFVGGAVRFGYINFNLSLLDRRENHISMIFSKFSMWWRAVCMNIALMFFIFLTFLLFIIPGIVSVYAYAMVPYILEEKPRYSVMKAMHMSRKMMRGEKFNLFKLKLSFIGWWIIEILTLGLASFFITPYINMAETAFFNEISGRADAFYGRKKVEDEEEDE